MTELEKMSVCSATQGSAVLTRTALHCPYLYH